MCHLCKTKPVYTFTNKRQVCARCFIKYFDKKFLYVNRKFSLMKKGNVIIYKNSEDFRAQVLKYLLKKFENKLMIEVGKKSKKPNHQKLASHSTIDLEAYEIIKTLINKKISDFKKLSEFSPINKNIIKPLYFFTDEEVLIYAKLKKLKYKKPKKRGDSCIDFIDGLEKKHPEIKRAIIKSFLRFSNKQNL